MRRYVLVCVLLFHALGIWLGNALPAQISTAGGGALFLVASLLFLLCTTRARPFKGPLRSFGLVCVSCGCVSLGMVRIGVDVAQSRQLRVELPVGETLLVHGLLERKGNHWRLRLDDSRHGVLLISRFSLRGWRDGQRVWLRGVRRPAVRPIWPGAYDGGRPGAVGGWFHPTGGEVLAQPGLPSAQQLRARLMRLWRGSLRPRTRALLGSILLGERSLLGRQQLADFKAAGMYHLLVVSGLHVYALVALVTWLPRRWGAKRPAWVLGITMAIALDLLVGGQVSVNRAALTCCLGLSLRRGGWQPDPLALLSLVAWLILLFKPAELFAPGFQLSFAAVCSLVLGPGPGAEPSSRGLWNRGRRWLLQALWASTRVTLATAPLLAYHFGAVSVIAVLANLIAIPAASLLLILAAVSLPLAALCGQVPGPLTALLEALCSGLSLLACELARVPMGRVAVSGLAPVASLGLLLACFWIFKNPRRSLRWCVFFVLLQAAWPLPVAGLRLTTVRVRGLRAVLVQTASWQVVLGERTGELDRFLLAQGLLPEDVPTLPDPLLQTPAGPLWVKYGGLHLPGFQCAWRIPPGVHRWVWQEGVWRLQRWGLPPPVGDG